MQNTSHRAPCAIFSNILGGEGKNKLLHLILHPTLSLQNNISKAWHSAEETVKSEAVR